MSTSILTDEAHDISSANHGESDIGKDRISAAVSRQEGETIANEVQVLHRRFLPRHVAIITIAGSIGTGLVIGTGSALANAGPASILIAYSIVGIVLYLVSCAPGKLATWIA